MEKRLLIIFNFYSADTDSLDIIDTTHSKTRKLGNPEMGFFENSIDRRLALEDLADLLDLLLPWTLTATIFKYHESIRGKLSHLEINTVCLLQDRRMMPMRMMPHQARLIYLPFQKLCPLHPLLQEGLHAHLRGLLQNRQVSKIDVLCYTADYLSHTHRTTTKTPNGTAFSIPSSISRSTTKSHTTSCSSSKCAPTRPKVK